MDINPIITHYKIQKSTKYCESEGGTPGNEVEVHEDGESSGGVGGKPLLDGATLSMNVSGVDVTQAMFSKIWRGFIMFHLYINLSVETPTGNGIPSIHETGEFSEIFYLIIGSLLRTALRRRLARLTCIFNINNPE